MLRPSRSKVIYLAGPYRGDVSGNIKRTMAVAEKLWNLGWTVLCPHGNSANLKGDDSIFLEGDIVLLKRCDMLVLMPGWEGSAGTKGEFIKALEFGIPVFRLDEVLKGKE